MTIIFEMLSLLQAWLIPHLMAKSSTFKLVTNTVWWTVLIRGMLVWWICATDVIMSFLILASVTMRAVEEAELWRTRSSSSWAWLFSFPFLFTKTKEKRSENLSDNQFPGVNSWWRGSKEGKILYDLTLALMMYPFVMFLCWFVGDSIAWRLEVMLQHGELSIKFLTMWFSGSLKGQISEHLASFCRWNLIGMIPTIASISSDGDVLKAPKIQIAALLYILFNNFMWYAMGTLL